ncbi:MAG: FlgD immunoglobulin-like domain containing protein, partial [Candidatus Cloacimonas sp.]|nr:FlgD immunoglobulin-like domain containing protein [Candidatus Cloacimonas sp.]
VGNTYTLNPVTSATNNIYKLAIPGSNSQYLVFEYRKRGSDIFEAELPGSGLLIYRINTNYEGNADGPPDEVYIFRPNGNTTVNGLIADAAFSANVGQTQFNAYTNPSAFLSNGNPIQVNINNISAAGETISFQVSAATAALAPVISSISPVSGSILANNDFAMVANVSAPNSSVSLVDFLVEGVLVSDYEAPYTAVISGAGLSLGLHTIEVTAHAANGMQTSKSTTVNIIDPALQNWFSWLSDDPIYEEYGRGAVPIKAAVDFDLGTQSYRVKGLKYAMLPDAWGEADFPGMVTAKINRFAGGAITEETLIDLGYIYNFEYDPDYVFTIADTTRISGQIAVILDLYDYQNILFDNNAPCGHSWLSEPNRTWTDALGRGIVGAAAIQLLLQSPTSANADELIPASGLQLFNRPNPFVHSTTISYSSKEHTPTKITIYNLKGQVVKTLVNETKASGQYETTWNGHDSSDNKVASGVYYYRLEAGGKTKTAKMLLLQ